MPIKQDIQWEGVKSSMIEAIAFRDETIFVRFNRGGVVWSYKGASEATFHAMRDSESVGKYFIANVKNSPSYSASLEANL